MFSKLATDFEKWIISILITCIISIPLALWKIYDIIMYFVKLISNTH
jgi:hypothetical protein